MSAGDRVTNIVAPIRITVLCPGCGLALLSRDGLYLQCVNQECSMKHTRYECPTILLKVYDDNA